MKCAYLRVDSGERKGGGDNRHLRRFADASSIRKISARVSGNRRFHLHTDEARATLAVRMVCLQCGVVELMKQDTHVVACTTSHLLSLCLENLLRLLLPCGLLADVRKCRVSRPEENVTQRESIQAAGSNLRGGTAQSAVDSAQVQLFALSRERGACQTDDQVGGLAGGWVGGWRGG